MLSFYTTENTRHFWFLVLLRGYKMGTLASCHIQYLIQIQYYQFFYFIPRENAEKAEAFSRQQMKTLAKNDFTETQ